MNAHDPQREAKLGQITTCDLRRIMLGSTQVIFLRVEAQHTAGSCSSRSPRSLLRGSFAYSTNMECGQSGPGRVGRKARQTTIDDGSDTFYGHGTLCDIRSQD